MGPGAKYRGRQNTRKRRRLKPILKCCVCHSCSHNVGAAGHFVSHYWNVRILAKASKALPDEHGRAQLSVLLQHCSGDRTPHLFVAVEPHGSQSRIWEVHLLFCLVQMFPCIFCGSAPGIGHGATYCMSYTKWPMFCSANVMNVLWYVHLVLLHAVADERC